MQGQTLPDNGKVSEVEGQSENPTQIDQHIEVNVTVEFNDLTLVEQSSVSSKSSRIADGSDLNSQKTPQLSDMATGIKQEQGFDVVGDEFTMEHRIPSIQFTNSSILDSISESTESQHFAESFAISNTSERIDSKLWNNTLNSLEVDDDDSDLTEGDEEDNSNVGYPCFMSISVVNDDESDSSDAGEVDDDIDDAQTVPSTSYEDDPDSRFCTESKEVNAIKCDGEFLYESFDGNDGNALSPIEASSEVLESQKFLGSIENHPADNLDTTADRNDITSRDDTLATLEFELEEIGDKGDSQSSSIHPPVIDDNKLGIQVVGDDKELPPSNSSEVLTGNGTMIAATGPSYEATSLYDRRRADESSSHSFINGAGSAVPLPSHESNQMNELKDISSAVSCVSRTAKCSNSFHNNTNTTGLRGELAVDSYEANEAGLMKNFSTGDVPELLASEKIPLESKSVNYSDSSNNSTREHSEPNTASNSQTDDVLAKTENLTAMPYSANLTEVESSRGTHSATILSLAKNDTVGSDDESDFTVSVVTWNLGEESPPEQDASFLRRFRTLGDEHRKGSDFVLVSAQECENVKPRRTEGRRSREFRRLMIKMLGKKYVPIAMHLLGGIQFGLFCKRDILDNLEHVSVADVTCGVGNVFHNKGAIAAYVAMKGKPRDDSSRSKTLKMLFVTAHMAAHTKNTEGRNADFWRIVSEIEAQAPPRFLKHKYDDDNDEPHECRLMECMDRIFFCGDLNYRLDLSREEVQKSIKKISRLSKRSDPNHMRRIEKLRNFLLQHDQLRNSIADGSAFPGFSEGTISFLPTFKYDKGTDEYDTSPKQRIPAWTDRVLFKPLGTKVVEYDCVQEACHSDHRPVYATFRVSREVRSARSRSKRSTRRK